MNNLYVPITRDIFNVGVLKPGMLVKFSVLEADGWLKGEENRVENFGIIDSIDGDSISIITNPSTGVIKNETMGDFKVDKNRYLRLFDQTPSKSMVSEITESSICISMTISYSKDISLQLSFLREWGFDQDVKVYYWR